MSGLKDDCIARLEEWILSGELRVGQRLPAERALAERWLISRPVVHEAIVELRSKGLVRIVPRHGVYVNDFRTCGSISMLSSLIAFPHNSHAPDFVNSLFELRMMLECGTARLAAQNRTAGQLQDLFTLANSFTPDLKHENLVELVFQFNHMVALASQNLIYPLIINSFKEVYYKFASVFLENYQQEETICWIRATYLDITRAIEIHDGEAAAAHMRALISTGETLYRQVILPGSPNSG